MRAAYCTGKLGREANDAVHGTNLLALKKLMDKKVVDKTKIAEGETSTNGSGGTNGSGNGRNTNGSGSGSSTTLTSRSDIFGDATGDVADKLDAKKLQAAHERASSKGKKDKDEDERYTITHYIHYIHYIHYVPVGALLCLD